MESKPTLVARCQQPGVILSGLWHGGQRRNSPVGVARARRLDLDHVGAEIRKDSCCSRRGDETAAIENLQAFEHQLRHWCTPITETLSLSDAHAPPLTEASALRIARCFASRSASSCSGVVAASDVCAWSIRFFCDLASSVTAAWLFHAASIPGANCLKNAAKPPGPPPR